MKIEAIVFVYRHETGHIRTRYIDDPEPGEGWVHIETLNPALWIAAHFDDTRNEREACALVADDIAVDTNTDDFALDRCYEIAAAIRARGEV
jgi:hypothetical protein